MRGKAVSYDRDKLGHLASGVWCGLQNQKEEGTTFLGMWAESDGPTLRIHKPPQLHVPKREPLSESRCQRCGRPYLFSGKAPEECPYCDFRFAQ